MYTPQFVCSSVDGHLNCFHILVIVNNAAVNIGVQIFIQLMTFNFGDIYSVVKLLDHMVFLCLIF